MQAEAQLQFYRTRFGRIPTRLQLDQFRTDLARLNLDVMAAALRQTERIAQDRKRPPQDVRLAVLGQYDRLVASIGQLFPVFFAFESAFRSYAAARLSLIYGSEDWWHGVRDAVASGAPVSTITDLNGRSAIPEVVMVVSRILSASPQRDRLATTYDLIEEATVGQVERLIERHWTDMATPFSDTAALGVPTSAVFVALFSRVRRARNDAYHHRLVPNAHAAVSAAEQLLDLLDIHLGTRVAPIMTAQPPQLSFAVFKEARHA
ncbi:hypothetical protein [Sphingomonas sp. Ant20]|jgi:hypothetical protein|uniref:hypothetical protein n=1 Tax=Sphingomonas sp. Ant20 TaxID=104605 RepID=UPI000538B987|nr:hypothetical protein [Sphingomonas sp. Ant20]KHA63108.1 hypothetical protein NI18_18430 [Sphingomonas sp. Ant20]